MKILIVNQPIGNRGDESAHRALIHALGRNKNLDIEVLFVGTASRVSDEIIDSFAGDVSWSNVKYLKYKTDPIFARFPYRSFFMPTLLRALLELFSPTARKVLAAIREADLILCAPGGVCMGPYRAWDHIWYLHRALNLGKKVAIYSRSFGPFLEESKRDIKFKNVSIDILRRLSFLSLRDAKSQEYAKQLGINFIESIDTAFLENPQEIIPQEYKYIADRRYAVFVPNELNAWHYNFRDIGGEKFETFYKKIIEHLIAKKLHVVMLPQTCKPGIKRDYLYFQKLSLGYGENVTVVPDKYDSGIQQAIIRSSSLVIGARYHSIIFAINNSVPFLSLSYEHKMRGMLNILGLSDMDYDLKKKGVEKDSEAAAMIDRVLNDRVNYVQRVRQASEKAKGIAESCFSKFMETIHCA